MTRIRADRPLCTGETGGHIDDYERVRYRVGRPPHFPGLELQYWQAEPGRPCLHAGDPDAPVGLTRPGETAPWLWLPPLHVGAIFLLTRGDGRQAVARIIGRASDDGDLVDEVLNLNGVTNARAHQITEAWEAITAVVRRGRRAGSHVDGWELTANQAIVFLMQAQDDVRHARPRGQLYTWAELHGLKRATIRRYLQDYAPSFWQEYTRFH